MQVGITGVTGHTLTVTVSDLLRSRRPFHLGTGGLSTEVRRDQCPLAPARATADPEFGSKSPAPLIARAVASLDRRARGSMRVVAVACPTLGS
jgi:hypothetical protein